uniref:Zinc finger protein 830 n=1 Tax=Plectus sambesii TaxID=2011161 RepID=A0A914USI4_9BILA
MSSVKDKFAVNSPLAKTLANGQISCIVCNTTVKSAMVWTAHVNSRKHVETVANLKKAKQQQSSAKVTEGTAANNNNTVTHSAGDKRSRGGQPDAASPAVKKSRMASEPLPSDFFDSSVKKAPTNGARVNNTDEDDDDDDESMSATTSNNFETTQQTGTTPWHAESEKKLKARVPEPPKPNTTEALPEGFFDDAKQDRKIRNAPDPNAALDEEYLKFQREMQQVEQQQLENALEDDESELFEREIEDIDNQMSEWTRVNQLEKKKVDMFTAAAAAQKARAEQMAVDDDDEEIDSDVDLDQIVNWRTKNI